ncbi:MAG: TrkH family potassium uptake protein [bacterium]
MQFFVIQRVLGLLLIVFSFTLLPPAWIGWMHDDPIISLLPFLEGFGMILWGGIILWAPVYKQKKELRLRDGFLIVVLFWLVLGVAGSIPFILYADLEISLTDAVFESISGLTTTGATVITNLDALPKSILFYRQQLQWLGGMGIIVLAVAILPMLGVGGMQLYRAETPGPIKDSKLTPRIKETAKLLWYIYLLLTVLCAISYRLAGMNWFDSVSHAFSTIAIGGFSTHNASIGFFDSPLIEWITVIFIFIAGINFSLHFLAWRHKSLWLYLRDSEFRVYFLLLLSLVLITSTYLHWRFPVGDSFFENFRQALFQVVSFMTTTGYASTSFDEWPSFILVLLVFSSFIGGCASSTAGGMKVIRFLLLFKQGMREIMRLIHPNAIISIKVNRKRLPERVVEAVWGFFAVYVALFALFMLLVLSSGVDQVTAFSAVAATLNNLGPGLGQVYNNYANLEDYVKWVLCLAMLMGRLEIFTLLVVLSPAFWRR